MYSASGLTYTHTHTHTPDARVVSEAQRPLDPLHFFIPMFGVNLDVVITSLCECVFVCVSLWRSVYVCVCVFA